MTNEQKIKELEKKVEELQARFDFLLSAVDHLPNPIFMKDSEARFFFFNKAYSNFFGMKRKDYIGKTVLDLDYLPIEDRERFQSEDLYRIANSDVISYDTSFVAADGIEHPSFYWSRGFRDKISGRSGLVGEIVDISKERMLKDSLDESMDALKEANERLRVMAQTDHASGLYNRSVLWEKGKALTEFNADPASCSCMIMLDLDNFKHINDKYGHLRGDEALAQFARILRSECRGADLPIRYGGDEFLLILSNIDLENAKKVAERIRKRCKSELTLPDGTPITVSVGVIAVNESEDFEKNLSRLDSYLYKAKSQGRDCVVWEL